MICKCALENESDVTLKIEPQREEKCLFIVYER